jgi:hypothetical protein
MKITFLMKTGATIDVVVPQPEETAFNFGVAIGQMRMNGYFQSMNIHIRYEEVSAALFITDEAEAPVLRKDLQ